MTVEQARRALANTFRNAGLDTPDLDARILVGHALGLDHTALVSAAARPLDAAEAAQIAACAARRLAGEPVARIVGAREFWGLPLIVTPAVLVPRPETETIVELALALDRRIARGPCASPISGRARARSCSRCCPNCRMPRASGPIFVRTRSRSRAATPSGSGLPAGRSFSRATTAAALQARSILSCRTRPTSRRATSRRSPAKCATMIRVLRSTAARTALTPTGRSPPMRAACSAPATLVVEIGAGQQHDVEVLFARNRACNRGRAARPRRASRGRSRRGAA